MYRAMIFDVDGTLGDTMPLCVEAFHRSIGTMTKEPLDDASILATFGPSEEGTVRALLPERYDEGLRAYWHWYEKLHAEYPAPFPGMREVLDSLRKRNVPLGLVTGKAERSAHITLNQFGLSGYFTAMAFGNPHGPRKPQGIASVLAQLGLKPDEAVYVGDVPSDITAARQVGIPIVAAAWACTADPAALADHHPDHLFTTVTEFAAFCDSVGA